VGESSKVVFTKLRSWGGENRRLGGAGGGCTLKIERERKGGRINGKGDTQIDGKEKGDQCGQRSGEKWKGDEEGH